MVKKPMIYSPFAVDRDVLDHLRSLGREVRQKLRPLAHLGRKRTIFIAFWLACMITLNGFVWFEEVGDIGLVDRPQRFLNALALLGKNFFLLPH